MISPGGQNDWLNNRLAISLPRHFKLTEREETGQTVVEFALTLTFLLFFTFGIFDVGRAVMTQSYISHAVEEGVRRSLEEPNDSLLVSWIADRQAILLPGLGDGTRGQILIQHSPNGQAPKRTTIQITYQFLLIMPLLDQVIEDGIIPLSASATILDSDSNAN